MIWSVEAALLFWFGRTRAVRLFELFSYLVMALAGISLVRDWTASYGLRTSYPSEFNLTPVANGDFVTAVVFVAAFAFIFIVNRDERHEPTIDKDFVQPIGYVIGAVGLFVLYNMFRIEIGNYFHLAQVNSGSIGTDDSVFITDMYFGWLNVVWQLNYTMLFLGVMALANLQKFRSRMLAVANVSLAVFTLMIVATGGMYLLYLLGSSQASDPGIQGVGVRYITYAISGFLLFTLYRYSRDSMLKELLAADVLLLCFEAVFYTFVFITVSCELVYLMDQFNMPDATKLGLTILWGVYALVLIVIGIAWDKKHLRIAAMALLGVTLAKLFFYDITDLGTIPKTILFVTLGITLLMISFLYNKYKDVIFGSRITQEPPAPDSIYDET
jgi:hypothetical protein